MRRIGLICVVVGMLGACSTGEIRPAGAESDVVGADVAVVDDDTVQAADDVAQPEDIVASEDLATPEDAEGPQGDDAEADVAEAGDDIPAVEDAGPPPEDVPMIPESCDVGFHLTAAGCEEWQFETVVSGTVRYTGVAVNKTGGVGAHWRISNDTWWGIRKSDGSWDSWSGTKEVPLDVVLTDAGELFALWYETGNGKSYYLDRFPAQLASPLQLENQGEGAALTFNAAGLPTVAFVAGYKGLSLDLWEGLNGSAKTVVESSSLKLVDIATTPSGMLVMTSIALDGSLHVFRRKGSSWDEQTTSMFGPPRNGEYELQTDADGNAHIAYETDGKLIYGVQGGGAGSQSPVSTSAGSGRHADIAIRKDGTVFVMDTDAETDLRLHYRKPGAPEFTTEIIVAGRSYEWSGLTIDATGVLHATMVYEYPSGDRELRYGWVKTQ